MPCGGGCSLGTALILLLHVHQNMALRVRGGGGGRGERGIKKSRIIRSDSDISPEVHMAWNGTERHGVFFSVSSLRVGQAKADMPY